MDFKRLNEYALETSRNELADHFDWSAFLVYSMAISNLDFNANDIEGTEIDDNIKNIFDDFSKLLRHNDKFKVDYVQSYVQSTVSYSFLQRFTNEK